MLQKILSAKRLHLFLLAGFWAALFVLYLPAAQAGRVGDFPGWVHFLNSVPFTDYLNRKGSQIASMYQFTQLLTYVFYKLAGASPWAWHLLFITMQSVNAWLLFRLCRKLCASMDQEISILVAASGALLFCLSPAISEVVVWKPAFHYLLGLMLLLLVLLSALRYLETREVRFALLAGSLFFLSSFSLEVFYLTPFLSASLLLLPGSQTRAQSVRYGLMVLLPQVLIFGLHLVLVNTLYHAVVAHSGRLPIDFSLHTLLSKPMKTLFHLLLLGRFWNADLRKSAYVFLSGWSAMLVFYGLVVALLLLFVLRWRKLDAGWKSFALLFLWTGLSLALIAPLWFPDSGQVAYDRYAYVSTAFLSTLLVLLFARFVSRNVLLLLVFGHALTLGRYTHKVNTWWKQSAHIVNNLVATFPNDTSKTVLLLDIPECYDGVQMIGTRDDGEFKMLYEAVTGKSVPNPVYDVVGFYMVNIYSGAHVIIINDSTARVSLDQWGSYWTYLGMGAFSYENSEYRVDMRDLGRWYYITLKHPPSGYLLLFNNGDHWSTVNWNKRNVDQY